MAFNAEAVARLRLDTTDAERSLTRFGSTLATSADKAGAVLAKKFSFGSVFKGLLQGTGLFGAGKIAEALQKPFEAAAEHAKTIYEWTEKTLSVYQRIFEGRRTDQQNIDAIRKDSARLHREMAIEIDKAKPKTSTVTDEFGREVSFTETSSPKQLAARERIKEIEHLLAENAAKEQELTKKVSETQTKAADERQKQLSDLMEAEEEAAFEKLNTDKQIVFLLEKQARLRRQVSSGGMDNLIKAMHIEKEITQLKEKQKRDQEEADEKANKARKERRDLIIQEAKVHASMVDAEIEYDNRLRNRSAFTLQEAAAGTGGSATDRAKAQQILQLERRARRVRSITDFKDPQGRRADAGAFADSLINRADAIRGSMAGMRSEDRDPMAESAKDIAQSREYLAEISKKLDPESIQ